MIKVLIVDDEVLAINYLKNIMNWQEEGFEIIGEATNGKKALEIYLEKQPQIVISDIKMPIMDGLQLTRHITQSKNRTKVLLTTAYKDFEYAKEAIKYGVSNYLLKHEISKQSLTDELNKIKKEIQQYEQFEKMVREKFIKNIFEGNCDWSTVSDFDRSNFGEKFILLVVKKDTPYHMSDKEADTGRDQLGLIDTVRQVNINALEEIKYITSLEIDSNICVILLSVDAVYSELKINELIYEFIKSLQEQIKKEQGCSVSTAVTTQKRINELAAAFREASYAIRYALFKGTQSIMYVNELPTIRPDASLNLEKYYKRLDESLKGENGTKGVENEGMSEILDELFSKLSSPYWNLSELRHVVIRLNQELLKIKEVYRIIDLEYDHQPCFTIDQIKAYYVEKYRECMREISKMSKNQYSMTIQKVIEYMIKNYNREIALDDIGEKFGLNGIYLGQVFKKEVGITFLKYLTNYRVEEAKKRLITGKYNVSEVAEQVGYKTAQYFSQIFFKAVGVKPQEYKKWGERK